MYNEERYQEPTKFKSAGKFTDDEGNILFIEFDNDIAIVRYKVLYTALLEQAVLDGKVYNSRMDTIQIPTGLLSQLRGYHQK